MGNRLSFNLKKFLTIFFILSLLHQIAGNTRRTHHNSRHVGCRKSQQVGARPQQNGAEVTAGQTEVVQDEEALHEFCYGKRPCGMIYRMSQKSPLPVKVEMLVGFFALLMLNLFGTKIKTHKYVSSHIKMMHMSDPTCYLFIAFIYVLIYVPWAGNSVMMHLNPQNIN